MKKTIIAASLTLLCATLSAQEKIDSTVITAFRANENTPVAHTEIRREQLGAGSSAASLPMALSLQPSTVTCNEGGNGLGNSKMRVRGSDASRINVTINGVTLNDAESQEVFWVNIPSISGFLESVQLQRGLGTSVNGPGAFGASVNMQTQLPGRRYARAEVSGGSYLTGTVSAAAGSGRLKSGLSLDGSLFCGTTEGYIENGFARVLSAFASAGWLKGGNSVKLNWILGTQRSGITWNGCPPEMLEVNRRYNTAHKGDSDNYMQNHLQGVYIHQFSSNLFWTTTLNYTRGGGYYNTFLASSGPEAELRQAESNNYYVASTNLTWKTSAASVVANLSASVFDSEHHNYYFGSAHEISEDICRNYGLKKDASSFVRGEFRIGRATLYGDMQLRWIDYGLSGLDDYLVDIASRHKYLFFNPKCGVTVSIGKAGRLYASAAIGHKEPTRADIIAAISAGSSVVEERLADFEFGWRLRSGIFSAGVNLYMMEYKDQLLETGRLSVDGYKIKANVPYSYRRGVEITTAVKALKWLEFDANATFSTNRIVDRETGRKTEIIMSPAAVGMVMATVTPFKDFSAALSWKYVGSQYYDNTQSAERKLPAYDVLNAQAEYAFRKIKFAIFANNLLNRKYVADAWSDGVFEGFFPQAEFNFNIKITVTL